MYIDKNTGLLMAGQASDGSSGGSSSGIAANDCAFTTTAETGSSVAFTLQMLGVPNQCEWNIIDADGVNVTNDVRISRQWTSASEYTITFAGGWPEGNWILRPGGASGQNGQTGFLVDHVYANDSYGTVCYLDDDNAVDVIGYQGEAWKSLDLYIVSADSAVTGNIVLTLGGNRLVAPVTASLTELTWNLTIPAAGLITISRNTTDAEDTLKDSDGNVVTALLVDWRVN